MTKIAIKNETEGGYYGCKEQRKGRMQNSKKADKTLYFSVCCFIGLEIVEGMILSSIFILCFPVVVRKFFLIVSRVELTNHS